MPPSSDPTVELRPSSGRIGRYQLLAELGAGGMGTVYRALDPNLGREVAVKTVRPGDLDSAAARSRFDREARALAALRHDNVLAVYDYSGLAADPVYLVTELVDGEDLGAARDRRGRLSLAAATAAVREVAAGLAAAHAAGLIHRDVKPSNVLVDGRGRVVLADFGVARPPVTPVAGGATQSFTFAGTPGYMSPEQIEGHDLDARSDLWSLGATAYQLITGERPFTGRNLHEALGHAVAGEYRRAAERPEFAPAPALAQLVDRCLSRDRDRRPGGAEETVAVLDAVLASLGVVDRRGALIAELRGAAPAVAPTAPAGPRRRRRAAAAAIVGVAVVAAAAVVAVAALGGGPAPVVPTEVATIAPTPTATIDAARETVEAVDAAPVAQDVPAAPPPKAPAAPSRRRARRAEARPEPAEASDDRSSDTAARDDWQATQCRRLAALFCDEDGPHHDPLACDSSSRNVRTWEAERYAAAEVRAGREGWCRDRIESLRATSP